MKMKPKNFWRMIQAIAVVMATTTAVWTFVNDNFIGVVAVMGLSFVAALVAFAGGSS